MSCWILGSFQLKILQQPLMQLLLCLFASLTVLLCSCLDTSSCFGYSDPCRSPQGTSSLPHSRLLIPICLQVPRAVALWWHQAELPPAPGRAQRAAPEEPGGGARPERRPGRPGESPPPHQINLSKHARSLLSCRMHLASPIDNPICVSVCVCALARRLACPVSVLRMVRIATTCWLN